MINKLLFILILIGIGMKYLLTEKQQDKVCVFILNMIDLIKDKGRELHGKFNSLSSSKK